MSAIEAADCHWPLKLPLGRAGQEGHRSRQESPNGDGCREESGRERRPFKNQTPYCKERGHEPTVPRPDARVAR